MPPALLTREEVLDRLLDTFRQHGYDGASLSDLSQATGLVKASLYHHFPGGKTEMAVQVLAHLDRALGDHLYAPLRTNMSPARKLSAMIDAVDAFYDGGRKACLLERLTASVDRSSFRRPLKRAFGAWIEAVETVCREAGLPAAQARAHAEDFVIRVEGALIVCAATGDTDVFERTLSSLRRTVLASEA